jgi:hypothetical protein
MRSGTAVAYTIHPGLSILVKYWFVLPAPNNNNTRRQGHLHDAFLPPTTLKSTGRELDGNR